MHLRSICYSRNNEFILKDNIYPELIEINDTIQNDLEKQTIFLQSGELAYGEFARCRETESKSVKSNLGYLKKS